jgi:alpha-1,3-glucosyltransferase
LDYPPFFAWFEKLLGFVGQWVDPGMVEISALGYSSPATVVYQRLTVMISELVLYWSLQQYLKTSSVNTRTADRIVATSIFLHPGLWIVDHLHFQYNGLLYGILLHSIVQAKKVKTITYTFFFLNTYSFLFFFLDFDRVDYYYRGFSLLFC